MIMPLSMPSFSWMTWMGLGLGLRLGLGLGLGLRVRVRTRAGVDAHTLMTGAMQLVVHDAAVQMT